MRNDHLRRPWAWRRRRWHSPHCRKLRAACRLHRRKARCQGERLDKCVVSATKILLNGGIRFAGITEWWDASICLFHAISGGDPHDVQFKNIHPGSGSSAKQDGLYDASILLGKVDAHDLFIYEKAKERFRDLWERHRDKLPGHARCQELSKNTTFGAKVSEIAK